MELLIPLRKDGEPLFRQIYSGLRKAILSGETFPQAAEEKMNRPPFEVADIIRQHGKSFIENNRSWLTYLHLRVLHAIEHCRTAALGGHLDGCSRCGYRSDISYNSCLMGSF